MLITDGGLDAFSGNNRLRHVASTARIRQFWQQGTQLLDPGATDHQGREIRLREVATVMGLLFTALWHGDAFCLNPAASLLVDRFPCASHGYLALRLIFKCMLHCTKTVH